jgi:lipid II:glycine glycyltransferase (peptidoglycan interpeptide bridge formation enzyme)
LFQDDQGAVFLARHENKAVAGIICARFGGWSTSLNAAFDYRSRQMRLNPALQWRVMQWAKTMGCRKYDMGGAATRLPPQEGNRGFGIYQFKKDLGAELHYYAGYFDLTSKPALYAFFRFLEREAIPRAYTTAGKLISWWASHQKQE